jgi:hypothetical protein
MLKRIEKLGQENKNHFLKKSSWCIAIKIFSFIAFLHHTINTQT